VLAYFKRNDGKYQYSGRVSDDSDFDVSKLAKSFGGGGHAKAAGFTLDHEIEELQPKGAGVRAPNGFPVGDPRSNSDLLSLEEPDSD
jgi:nanoRNase/pAp phosphatase (c-di-AMP/oligoRNAs hydrolase)